MHVGVQVDAVNINLFMAFEEEKSDMHVGKAEVPAWQMAAANTTMAIKQGWRRIYNRAKLAAVCGLLHQMMVTMSGGCSIKAQHPVCLSGLLAQGPLQNSWLQQIGKFY